jgi:hypothetical protein
MRAHAYIHTSVHANHVGETGVKILKILVGFYRSS